MSLLYPILVLSICLILDNLNLFLISYFNRDSYSKINLECFCLIELLYVMFLTAMMIEHFRFLKLNCDLSRKSILVLYLLTFVGFVVDVILSIYLIFVGYELEYVFFECVKSDALDLNFDCWSNFAMLYSMLDDVILFCCRNYDYVNFH